MSKVGDFLWKVFNSRWTLSLLFMACIVIFWKHRWLCLMYSVLTGMELSIALMSWKKEREERYERREKIQTDRCADDPE
jgi:hypothetical protein